MADKTSYISKVMISTSVYIVHTNVPKNKNKE